MALSLESLSGVCARWCGRGAGVGRASCTLTQDSGHVIAFVFTLTKSLANHEMRAERPRLASAARLRARFNVDTRDGLDISDLWVMRLLSPRPPTPQQAGRPR